jgi:hypothetical protein
VIVGSSNWSSASDNSQQEHNYWKIVSKTAAGKTATGTIWTFTTGN